jgi:hypothetical protein
VALSLGLAAAPAWAQTAVGGGPGSASEVQRHDLPPTAFRVSDLDLRDPHIFLLLFGLFCTDITETLNDQVATSISSDSDGDGYLDLSSLLILRPLDPSRPAGRLDFAAGACTDPAATTVCDLDAAGASERALYANLGSGTCLAPYAGTTRPYTPAIAEPTAPCFVSTALSAALEVCEVTIPFRDAQVAAGYDGDPAQTLSSGLLRAFLSEADADQIALPGACVGSEEPVVIASLLPGGTGNCAAHDDRDLGLDGATVGWWFYFNFAAGQVAYVGP